MDNNHTYKALYVEEVAEKKFTQTIKQCNEDDLPDNELLIDVQYSSLNFKDAMSAFGNKAITQSYPHTPGIDAAGIVIEDKTGTFMAGEQVLVFGYDLGMNTPGGLSQRIRIPANWAVKCPKTLTLKEAMTYGTGGLTAALCIEKIERLGASPKDGPIAVTGATGGVGSISVALLNQLGYQVVAFSGKPEQTQHLKDLGADQVEHRDVINEVQDKMIAKSRWSHGIDTLGGEPLFNLLKCIHPGGAISACGLAAGATFHANVMPFITRGVSILGVDSVFIPLKDKQHIWQRVATDMKLPNLAQLSTEITLEQVPEYLNKFFKGKVVGRYVVNLTS